MAREARRKRPRSGRAQLAAGERSSHHSGADQRLGVCIELHDPLRDA